MERKIALLILCFMSTLIIGCGGDGESDNVQRNVVTIAPDIAGRWEVLSFDGELPTEILI